jgi:hypothetical protein
LFGPRRSALAEAVRPANAMIADPERGPDTLARESWD